MRLRMFLLATGERGIGYQAVFGDKPLSWAEFEEFSYYQQRILLASTEEGRNDIQLSLTARRLDEIEAREAQIEQMQASEPAFDPERMTPEEIAAWMARYEV